MPQQYFDPADIEKNKIKGAVGYVIPLVPLFACKNSPFGRFCANQGVIYWGCAIVLGIASWVVALLIGFVPLVGWIAAKAFDLAQFAIFLVAAYHGYIAYSQGKAMELPIVGSLRILK